MKDYEYSCLESLLKEPVSPLQNIRKHLGYVRESEGNPLTKTEIKLTITITYYDATGGSIIAPAALPTSLKTYLPCYLFNFTDFQSAYLKMTELLPPPGGVTDFVPVDVWSRCLVYGGTYIIGNAYVYHDTIPTDLGDMIFYYPVFSGANVYEAFIRIHCDNVAYGTFLLSLVSEKIFLSTLRYSVPLANINQFSNPVTFVYQNMFGKYVSDDLEPKAYISNDVFQQQICDMSVNIPLLKNIGLGFNIAYDCTNIEMILFVQNI